MFNLFNKKTETNLLQTYTLALNEVKNNSDFETKLGAFNQVINFCSKDLSCLNDNSRKRDMILYWTYSNIGDIFSEKAFKHHDISSYYEAQENYQRALNFSRNSEEKIAVLERLANLYEQQGDLVNFYTVKDLLIEAYPIEERRNAFEELSETVEDATQKIYFLEKALDFIKYENIPAVSRCKNTIRLCKKLRTLYADKKDYVNLARIEELRTNTSYLIH